jgi:hypothetical protein
MRIRYYSMGFMPNFIGKHKGALARYLGWEGERGIFLGEGGCCWRNTIGNGCSFTDNDENQ